MLHDYQGTLEDLDKADVLEPNNAFTLTTRARVKRMLHDYQGALEDLDKADVLEPNNAFTLRTPTDVKRMLHDYQGALEDLDKADVLEPNNVFALRTRENVKRMLKECQGAKISNQGFTRADLAKVPSNHHPLVGHFVVVSRLQIKSCPFLLLAFLLFVLPNQVETNRENLMICCLCCWLVEVPNYLCLELVVVPLNFETTM
jgi:tetratricopeptide (TPR) repeat protein